VDNNLAENNDKIVQNLSKFKITFGFSFCTGSSVVKNLSSSNIPNFHQQIWGKQIASKYQHFFCYKIKNLSDLPSLYVSLLLRIGVF